MRSDLVTEFDVRSEVLIRELLARETPGVAIVAEEQGGTASDLTCTSSTSWKSSRAPEGVFR